MPISYRQIDILSSITSRGKSLGTNTANPWNAGGNNRAVQPLNDRTVYVFGEEEPEPEERDSTGLYDYRQGGMDW